MVGSPYFGGKSHVSTGCKMYLLRSPVQARLKAAAGLQDLGLLVELVEAAGGLQVDEDEVRAPRLSAPPEPLGPPGVLCWAPLFRRLEAKRVSCLARAC